MFQAMQLEDPDDEFLFDMMLAEDLRQFTQTAEENEMENTVVSTTNQLETEQGTTLIEGTVGSEEGKNSTSPTQPRPRHHRRKSTHQMVRTSPDMEFETLSLEEETDTSSEVEEVASKKSPKKTKKRKRKPSQNKLATNPPTPKELFDAEFEDFLNDDETKELIKNIALERLRLNTLLLINNMPVMDFSLYTNEENSNGQLGDCLKEHGLQQENKES